MHKYLTLAALFIAAPLAAQMRPPTDHRAMGHDRMSGMDGLGEMPMMKNTAANPYAEAGMAMHHKMMVTGADASETWTRQMIEHHRGAAAMSKIATVQATDKETRTMAEKDIAMQNKDIATLQSWLKRHGKTPQ